jgi:hypothetical protein
MHVKPKESDKTRRPMTILRAATIVVFLGATASAQTGVEYGPDGAYLTVPVRKSVAQARAKEFARAASSVGFTPKETRFVADAIRDGKLSRDTTAVAGTANAASVWTQTFKTPQGDVKTNTRQQVGLIAAGMQPVADNTFFETYATIHITVVPAPPRDYKIVINGEDCPPTEKSIYKVLPGKTTVSVSRAGKQPCAWAGPIASGKKVEVKCSL